MSSVNKMRKRSILASLLLAGTCLFMFSCKKDAKFPIIPAIEFKEFLAFGSDSAKYTLKFKDGDGDIGLEQSDTLGEFGPGKPYYYNFSSVYYYKNADGLFVPYDLDQSNTTFDTLKFNYRIPDITPEGQNKALSGDIEVTLQAPYYIPGHKAIMFKTYIYDRAPHKSNVIETPEIAVP